jgi:hypothetical protein
LATGAVASRRRNRSRYVDRLRADGFRECRPAPRFVHCIRSSERSCPASPSMHAWPTTLRRFAEHSKRMGY